MPIEVPYTSRPEDLTRLLELLPKAEVPASALEPEYFKSLGFSAASGRHLLNILKKLGFVDAAGIPAATWLEYASAENKGLVLAAAIKSAYPELFRHSFCPYLDDDEVLLDFFKSHVEATPKDMELMLQTFRCLVEPADFQDLLSVEGPDGPVEPVKEDGPAAAVKVDPALQITIQVHIDPATPDEKIETIFKNMRKYLLGKAD
jgi:hypothetical protein